VRPLSTGIVLSDRYRLESPLGAGATATVWRARDIELGRPVAVKVLGDDGVDPELASRFLREGRILGRLTHPNIVPVLAAGEDDGRPYLVMALVEGTSLRERLDAGPMSIDDSLDVVTAVAAGLADAHRNGVIHRDVKPANIVCGDDGRPRLVDFGIARASDLTTMTRADVVMGTAAYLAPEQALGETPGPASDVYSLGCVLYEALAGEPPFSGESAVAVAYRHVHDPVPMPSDQRPEIGGALDAIVARCLTKRPEDRYPDAAALESALVRLRSGDDAEATGALTVVNAPLADATAVLPITAAAAMAEPRRHRLGSHRRSIAVAGAIAAALLAILLVGAASDSGGSSSTPTSVATATTVAPPTTTAPVTVAVTAPARSGAKGKGKHGEN
jgi:serine/threonine-protein kinase